MKTIFRQLNPHACRTYIAGNEETKEVAIIDPVLEHVQDYLKLFNDEKMQLLYVIDTHTHADHISGGAALLDHINCEYLMHRDAPASCPTKRVSDGDKLDIAGLSAKIMFTPGHTKDSISLLFQDKILTGDVLFLDDAGAGRDDLPGGDPGEHWDSLQRIAALPEELIVYPAHEYRNREYSSLKRQKRTNPHLKPKTKAEYIQYVQELELGPAEWMKDVLKANYACARDPEAAWIPVDVPACEVKGTMSHGSNELPVEEISADLLQEKLNSSEPVVLLDVRDPMELESDLGVIKGIINIPVTTLSKRLNELDRYKDNEIVTICKTGGRAHTAAQLLKQVGFTNVVKLSGGMTAWKKQSK
ncbi:MAG: MBL fold metallo-hydrolase [Candidatus Anammoxibacter sp.]